MEQAANEYLARGENAQPWRSHQASVICGSRHHSFTILLPALRKAIAKQRAVLERNPKTAARSGRTSVNREPLSSVAKTSAGSIAHVSRSCRRQFPHQAQTITNHAQLASSVMSAVYYIPLDSVPKTNERMLLTTAINSLLCQKYGAKPTPITGACVEVLSPDMCFSDNPFSTPYASSDTYTGVRFAAVLTQLCMCTARYTTKLLNTTY